MFKKNKEQTAEKKVEMTALDKLKLEENVLVDKLTGLDEDDPEYDITMGKIQKLETLMKTMNEKETEAKKGRAERAKEKLLVTQTENDTSKTRDNRTKTIADILKIAVAGTCTVIGLKNQVKLDEDYNATEQKHVGGFVKTLFSKLF